MPLGEKNKKHLIPSLKQKKCIKCIKIAICGQQSLIYSLPCVHFKPNNSLQQGLEIHGLEEHGPWRYTVSNWIPKHLRYTVLGQKP